MLTRRGLLSLLGGTALSMGISQSAFAAREEEPLYKLRFGSMFPRDTAWAKVLSVWARHLEKQGQGQLGVNVRHNGSERIIDEVEIARRLGAGDLDGAVLTTVGLGTLVPAVQALHLPRAYADWAAGDAALASIRETLDASLAAAGLTVLGWGKMGPRYVMAQDVALRAPADLAAQLLYLPKGDAVLSALASAIGVVAPVSLDVIAVERRIKKGLVNTAICTATQALSRGWVGGDTLNRVTLLPIGFEWGALVVRSEALTQLPEFLRTLVLDSGPVAARNLDDRMVELDAQAVQTLKERAEVLTASESESALWDEVGAAAAEQLVKAGVLDANIVKALKTST